MASTSTNSPASHDENKLLETEILDSLKEFIGSEPFGQYLSEYITNTLRNIDRLGLAIASEDEERVKQMSHKLKGSAGNIGAIKLTSACSKLQEFASEEQSRDTIRQQFNDLRSAYMETKDALSEYIEQLEMSRLKAG